MEMKTYIALQDEVAGLKALLSGARVKMRETMAARDYEANRQWAQAVSRLENDISAKTRQMKQ